MKKFQSYFWAPGGKHTWWQWQQL